MTEYRGKSVFEGIAVGKLKIVRHDNAVAVHEQGTPEEERKKFYAAREKAVSELQSLYEQALATVGESEAEIFSMHAMMTEDADLEDAVLAKIDAGEGAAQAAEEAGFELSQTFIRMDDEYMRARAVDVIDVAKRLSGYILGKKEEEILLNEPSILASSDFTPSEVVKLDKSKVLGFVTTFGSETSHTSILARTLALPSVVNIRDSIDMPFDGKTCIVDGFTGKVIVDPDEETLSLYLKKKAETDAARERRQALIGQKSVTQDGREVHIYCNVGNSEDVKAALQNDGEGVGLLRSEFLYLESEDYPSEEKQYQEYSRAAKLLEGKLLVIRTMDIGADKQASYFHLPHEENPALGMRSVRICMDRPEILYTQLRAIYRASADGNVAAMVPMIISGAEVRWVRQMAEKVRADLKKEGIPFDEKMQIGIMIETPAAALIADELAKEADFFSIGSNDLIQYTLAADRQNQSLEKFVDPHHKAVLRLIRYAAECAHAEGKWIGVCGELARDLSLTEFFAACGIDELSVSPPYVLPLREKLLSVNVSKTDLDKYTK
ncbi:MAG TPA: phosphoenolpyruvate--protein phosphotransferase [Candidatus Borkfalkia faecipullorum]|uniref:Phosphoenolpyruvate-protein phosphotransferase n=1 Tax=Candidatus Borkfalkia faecipullorum TaxID=2838510 RepID=A0A9D1V7W2_9FIRM|nr:phosphoenolpyruvate--protein phosphotransferase [Candidatus Borkfalkia faecipullorum]